MVLGVLRLDFIYQREVSRYGLFEQVSKSTDFE